MSSWEANSRIRLSLIAKLDDPELLIQPYLEQIDRMAAAVLAAAPDKATARQRLAALDAYLFEQNGYHGSRTEYYHRANSYLNQVIDDREGKTLAFASPTAAT